MSTIPEVSPDQADANKQAAERKKMARGVAVSSQEPNPLVESRTVRNPLVPQPEPDTDPLQPMLQRPSRSKTDENAEQADKPKVHETRTGGADTERTHAVAGEAAPQPGPHVVDAPTDEQDDETPKPRRRRAAPKGKK